MKLSDELWQFANANEQIYEVAIGWCQQAKELEAERDAAASRLEVLADKMHIRSMLTEEKEARAIAAELREGES